MASVEDEESSYEEVEVTDDDDEDAEEEEDESEGKRVEWPPNQDEDQLVTVQVTTKSKTYSTQMDQQQEQQQHASTIVKNHFPAANNSMQKVNGVKHEFENNGGEQQRGEAANNIAGFGKELFRPGKLKNRWNPQQEQQQQQQQQGQDDNNSEQIRQKTKLRNVNEILQTNSVTHASYHVPPGTSRTRRAHENYVKNLDQLQEENSR